MDSSVESISCSKRKETHGSCLDEHGKYEQETDFKPPDVLLHWKEDEERSPENRAATRWRDLIESEAVMTISRQKQVTNKNHSKTTIDVPKPETEIKSHRLFIFQIPLNVAGFSWNEDSAQHHRPSSCNASLCFSSLLYNSCLWLRSTMGHMRAVERRVISTSLQDDNAVVKWQRPLCASPALWQISKQTTPWIF